MAAYLVDAATRGAVIIPAVLSVVAILWLFARALGILQPDRPVDTADIRTWPLSAALRDGLIFSATFSAAAPIVADSPEGVAMAAAIGATSMIIIGRLMMCRRGD